MPKMEVPVPGATQPGKSGTALWPATQCKDRTVIMIKNLETIISVYRQSLAEMTEKTPIHLGMKQAKMIDAWVYCPCLPNSNGTWWNPMYLLTEKVLQHPHNSHFLDNAPTPPPAHRGTHPLLDAQLCPRC